VILRLRGAREITAPIPWQNGTLWLSGAILLVDEMLYTVSAVATLFSLFILKDAPATPALLAGVAVVLGAIAASARIRE